MAAVAGLMILSFSAFVAVFALPDGAPPESCASVYPLGHTADTPSKDGEGNVTLNITAFSGGIYVPGKTYTCMIRGGGCLLFFVLCFVFFFFFFFFFVTGPAHRYRYTLYFLTRLFSRSSLSTCIYYAPCFSDSN